VTTWFVPGRIEVLGKHTDYAGGRSMVCATDRGVTARVTDRDEPGIVATSDASPDAITIGRGHGAPAVGHWGNYVATAVARLTANFGDLRPCQIDITSDLPLASGMSSSSALLSAVALALADHNGLPDDKAWRTTITSREDLAGYLACIENGSSFTTLAGHTGVGTFGGSEDHTAMVCGKPGQVSVFSFAPIRHEQDVPLPAGTCFVVAVSGVLAEKTGSALATYNNAAQTTARLLDKWQSSTGRTDATLAAALASAPDAFARLFAHVKSYNGDAARLRQFYEESFDLVPAAAAALTAGDLAAFGRTVDRSMELAVSDLRNQVPETVYLVQAARRLGAHAASAFGAGYGGSVWALVDEAAAPDFERAWLDAYLARFGRRDGARTLTVRPSAAAHRLD
jgi:galactokinase